MATSLRELLASTPLSGGNAPYVEALYEQFLADPQSVEPAWRDYFRRLQEGQPPQDGLKRRDGAAAEQIHSTVQAGIVKRASAPRLAAGSPGSLSTDDAAKQGAVSRLVQIYANRGHLIAKLDPLGLQKRERPRVLELGYFGLTEADLNTEFLTGSRPNELSKRLPLRELLAQLEYAYCGTIGAEFAHVSDTEERLWLQDEYLKGRLKGKLTTDEQQNLLWQLSAAEGLERYLHTKYVGQKRFSLEGGDSLIPLMDDLIQRGGEQGVEECVIGMAHRGRLNVLVNLLGKSPSVLFNEFEGKYDTAHMQGSGDVKYHKGFSSDLRTPGGNVHVALAFNPSHLEVVNPVVEGSVRARQERRGDTKGARVLPILIHGDAAFAGQGVVMETLQLSQARAFFTGGSIHVIVNNQVGFTTSDPHDARSTMYCSDVAKMLETPIFHVNGDDPEAVVFVTRLALAYRQRFHKDVVIDLVCYRRHGHNEADEPSATQPTMYQAIRKHLTTRKLYADKLVAQGLITDADAAAMTESYRQGLDEGRPQARASLGMIGNKYTVDWSKYLGNDWTERVKGGNNMARLKSLGERIVKFPANFALHPRVAQVMANRVKMMAGELPLDWGCAETLAYASILEEGNSIRFTGQDAGRGTFFHRHAVLHEQSTGARYIPLQHIAERQPSFQITDSVLSEEAVLGFEYGYSTTDPSALVIWEGQFGDFVNGAQVIIDQFISSGEAKWGRLCGLALFLPHGYEGQGPEHSSARLERFLQLCAENNMQVCVPSTPAQMYHMIRRQILRSLRKPLIVMTPKSLLRHELSVSSLEDLANGEFSNVIDEIDKVAPANVRRVVLSSGKVYFDLLKARRAQNMNKDNVEVALIRVEQLYPFPVPEMEAVLAKYPNAREVVWCQEEPQNQGAWYQIRHRLATLVGKRELLYAGRAPAAAPATGISKVHEAEQRGLIEAALSATNTEDGARETKRLMSISGSSAAPAAAATSR